MAMENSATNDDFNSVTTGISLHNSTLPSTGAGRHSELSTLLRLTALTLLTEL